MDGLRYQSIARKVDVLMGRKMDWLAVQKKGWNGSKRYGVDEGLKCG